MQGKLFVIEGLDGSGKQTQSRLLFENLKNEGYNVRFASYPNYKSESSALAKMYLRGDFGKDPEKISPYISSTFYAVDRYATYKTEFEEFYKNGGIIICDRYTTSNMVHQASKIRDKEERAKFLDWLWDLEFNIYSIPTPTKVFFLNTSTEASWKLMEERKNKFSHNDEKDIHETDFLHLKHSYDNALGLVKKYDWISITCLEDDKMRSIEDINKDILVNIKKYL